MFSRFKKKTSPAAPDSPRNPLSPADSHRIEEIEKTRRDLMLAALESFGDTATAPKNSSAFGLTDPESAEISPVDLQNDPDYARSTEDNSGSGGAEDRELERQLLLDDHQSAPLETPTDETQTTGAGYSAAQDDQSQFDLAEQIRAAGQAEKKEKLLQTTKSVKSVKYEDSLQTEPVDSAEFPEVFDSNQNAAVLSSAPPLVHDVEISQLTSPAASPLSQTQPKPLLRRQNHLLDEILIGIVKADIAALCRNHKNIKTS